MSYRSIMTMASSQSLRTRVAACAAEQGADNAVQWTEQHIIKLCTSPGWREAWAYAVDTYQINLNPDTGVRDDVISDTMILAAVQPIITAQVIP